MSVLKEAQINTLIKEFGLEPLDERCIIVKFSPLNLSAQLVDFFAGDFYVLQICKDKIVLIPINKLDMTMNVTLKKEVALNLPKSSIRSVEIQEKGFNYLLLIKTHTDQIALLIQQKEANSLRSSGGLTAESMQMGILTDRNWHADNLDNVLNDLKQLSSGLTKEN